MNWLRLPEIIEMARRRVHVGNPDPDPLGCGWACHCSVCCELRRLVA